MPASRYTPDQTLAEWFGFHPANDPAKRMAHEDVRVTFYALAAEMNQLLPEGPDKTVALRAVRDAAMQCNGVLAVNGGPDLAYDFSRGYGHIAQEVIVNADDTIQSVLFFG